jgi:hypothetical protein
LNEILSQVQGSEKTQVPDDIIAKVSEELRRHKVTEPKLITRAKVRQHLKRLNLAQFYKHTAQIARRLSGNTEVVIPDSIQRRLRKMVSCFLFDFDSSRACYLQPYNDTGVVVTAVQEHRRAI